VTSAARNSSPSALWTSEWEARIFSSGGSSRLAGGSATATTRWPASPATSSFSAVRPRRSATWRDSFTISLANAGVSRAA
jgi:hypothetical protein